MIASTWDMPLSTGMDMDRGPAGAETSSLNNSSAGCHRQLECSTRMTEGVSNHKNIPPNLSQHHPFPSTCLLVDPHPTPPGSNPSVWGNWSVETNGEKLPSREDAAGAALSKSHFTLLLSLSLSHLHHYQPPVSPGHPHHRREEQGSPGFSLLSAYSSFEVSWDKIWTVFTWSHLPCCVCQPEVITAQRVALTVMTRCGRCGEVGRAQCTSVSGAALTH